MAIASCLGRNCNWLLFHRPARKVVTRDELAPCSITKEEITDVSFDTLTISQVACEDSQTCRSRRL